MGFKHSGNNSIDALLKGKYWTDTGKSVALTYSINSSGSDGLDASERAMVKEALLRWSQMANISFREVSRGGNLRFSGESGTGGHANYKEARKWWNPFSWGTNKLDQSEDWSPNQHRLRDCLGRFPGKIYPSQGNTARLAKLPAWK